MPEKHRSLIATTTTTTATKVTITTQQPSYTYNGKNNIIINDHF
jgi:hypothetical protein